MTAEQPLTRRQVVIFSLTAMTLLLLLLLGLFEAALRLAGHRPSYLDADMYVPTGDDRGYGLRPSYRGLYAGARVRIGPLGLRGEEQGPGGILLLGDSALFGQGLEEQDTLAAQLQTRLAQRKVVNAGVPGYNTVAELAQLRHLLPLLQPALVVLIYVVDNDADLRPGVWLRPDGTLDLHLNQTLTGRISRLLTRHLALYSQLRGLWAIQQQAVPREDRTPFAPDDPGWRASREALLSMQRLLHDAGIPFAVGSIALVQNLQAPTMLAGFCQQHGIPYAPLWQTRDVTDFVRHRAISRTDSHADARTTGQMAEALLSLVRSLTP